MERKERKVGEVFNDGDDLIEVVISKNGNCTGCHYWGSPCEDRDECCKGLRSDSNSVIFKKIGELKMDNKEELKRSLAEEEQRAKDSLANVEKMKKQLEELNKKDEQPTVSANGVYLEEIIDKKYYFPDSANRIDFSGFDKSVIDTKRMSINNCFTTQEYAEQEALRREGQGFIRRCAMLWNKDHDWRKKLEMTQSCIFMTNLFDLKSINYSGNTYGQIFFDNYELAERCIAELEKKYNEKQLKIIFGVK